MKTLEFGGVTNPAALKSTLVSLVPFSISEFKPGLIPGQFDIEACKGDLPAIKVIGESVFHVYIDQDRGSLRVLDPSYKVAQSIVADYNQAQLGAKPECHPAFFWKLGDFTAQDILDKFPDEVEHYKKIQYNWFIELIKMADDDWEKTRQHYCISDIQRAALKSVDPTNSKGRPWVFVAPTDETKPLSTTLCPACGSDIPTSVVICRYCQYVLDPVKYAKMQFAGKSNPLGDTENVGIDLSKYSKQ